MQFARPRLRGVSHQFSCFVALGAGAVLMAIAGTQRALAAAAIYAVTLVALFGVSASYHRIDWSTRARAWWQRADHATIFVFIAGTYTPVCLLAIGGAVGSRMLTVIWIGAAVGVLQALFWSHAWRAVRVALYLALGGVMVFGWPVVSAALDPLTLGLLLGGGALYTTGALVYATQRPDPVPHVFGYHEVFHVLVILASVCHFAAVFHVVAHAT